MSAIRPDGYVDPTWPDPSGKNEFVPYSILLGLQLTSPSAPIIIYGYTPLFQFALFATILFTLCLISHTIQLLRYKSYYFITVPIGLVLEVLGYTFRCFSADQDPYSIIWFVLQYFFIVTAPVFLSAGIYAVLSVLINRVGRSYSTIPPKWVLGLFISSDVVTTIIQILGAALIGHAEAKSLNPNTGKNILLAGLCFQVFSFLIFLILTTLFFKKAGKVVWQKGRRAFLVAFVIATLLVYLRTCFRLAETAQGVKKYLFTHEAYFAGLEFAPISVAVILFMGWHPGRCLRRERGSGQGLETQELNRSRAVA
jgi:hypothetical protein